MLFSILTLFPDMFKSVFDYSIIKRAREQSFIKLEFINIRDFATDSYGTVDDKPYGGGVGMILKPDVIERALKSIIKKSLTLPQKRRILLLDAAGAPYSQKLSRHYTHYEHVVIICGHYEDIDARVESLVDETVSIGEYVLTGGEIPAMVLIDSITRLIPGVLPKEIATQDESFTTNLVSYPQFTRPSDFNGIKVPEVLLSGDHKKITQWRLKEAEKRTKKRTKLINSQTD